jgi:hypothetical protein
MFPPYVQEVATTIMEVDSEVVSKQCSQAIKEVPQTKHIKPHQSPCTMKEVPQTKLVSIVQSPCNVTTLTKYVPTNLLEHEETNSPCGICKQTTWSY